MSASEVAALLAFCSAMSFSPGPNATLATALAANHGLRRFLNIKAWMLALTLTAGWVVNAGAQPADNPGQRLAIISALIVVFAFASNLLYAVLGSLLRQWLSQGARLLWFNRFLALVLAAIAVWMLAV